MTDAGDPIRVAYHQLFSGLTHEGKSIGVYALMAPSDAIAPYVIVGPWVARSENTKTTFRQEGEITLDVVTRFLGGAGSTVPAAEIANELTRRIKSTLNSTLDTLSMGQNNWLTVIANISDLALQTKTDLIIRKIITVRHSFKQV